MEFLHLTQNLVFIHTDIRKISKVHYLLLSHLSTLKLLSPAMDDSTQQIRDQIICQIRGVLFEFLRDVGSGTMRILRDTPNSILDPKEYL